MQIHTVVAVFLGVVAAGSEFDRYNTETGKAKRVHYTDRPTVQMRRKPNGQLSIHIAKAGKVQVKEKTGIFHNYIVKPILSWFSSRHPHPYAVHRFHLAKRRLVTKAKNMLTELQKMPIGPKFCKKVNEINKILLQVDRNSTGVNNPACISYHNMRRTLIVHPAARQPRRRRGFLGNFRREKTYYRYDRDYNHINGKPLVVKHRDSYGRPGKRSTEVTYSGTRAGRKQKSQTTYRDGNGQKHKVKLTVARDGTVKVDHKVKRSRRHGEYKRFPVRRYRGDYKRSSVKRNGGYYKHSFVKKHQRAHREDYSVKRHRRDHSVKRTRGSDCRIRHRDYNSRPIKIKARDSNYGTGSYKIRSRRDAPCTVKKTGKHRHSYYASTHKVKKSKKSRKTKKSKKSKKHVRHSRVHKHKSYRLSEVRSGGSVQSQQIESKFMGMCRKMLAYIRSNKQNKVVCSNKRNKVVRRKKQSTAVRSKKRTFVKRKSSKCKHVKAGSPM
ncbi:hypothetical protein PSACC_02041, partial [Paramicrosporidium saccamoebae]